jgi:rubrerythrin
LIDAISALVLNNGIRLLQFYPLVNEKLQAIAPFTYFGLSAVATLVLWCMTCAVAFANPVEAFLNKILSDAKSQSAVESQILEEKGEILDVMSETIESNNETLAQVKDIVYNVRTEVKEIRPLNETVEKVKTEISTLKKELKKLEEKLNFPIVCPACGKPLLPEFKMCPYCGEDMRAHQTPVIALKEYK